MRSQLRKFLALESASGILLLAMTLLAMAWANSPFVLIHQQVTTAAAFLVNEGLMTIFFLVVGLELKRGFLQGDLSSSQVILPLVAAFGGMVVPILIYVFINQSNPMTLQGWATPVATDIAFAVGVLSLFGRRVPAALKLFLLALAIFDDLGAILIITIFYSQGLSWMGLGGACILLLALYFLNRFNIRSFIPYLLIGVGLWFCVWQAGVHPALSGVLLALMVPETKSKKGQSLSHQLEQRLHPWVAYFIMPVFALMNAGLSFQGFTFSSLTNQLVLGIVLGLFIGKQIGVFSFAWLVIRLKWAKLPSHTSWLELYGIALLCGIGFTMSLFLGTLSFPGESIYLSEVRLGVIVGSLLSGVAGAMVLCIAFSLKKNHPSPLAGMTMKK